MNPALFDKAWLKEIDLLTPEERTALVLCVITRRNYANSYWGQTFSRGRKCFEYIEGKILTPDELYELEDVEDKLVVQVARAKPAIEAIYGTLIETLKDGVVTANGPEDAPGQAVITDWLKKIDRDNSAKMKVYEAARNTGITSVPGWIWIENQDPENDGEEGVTLDYQEWDSVLPSPQWKDRQLRDMPWAIRLRQMSLDDVEVRYGRVIAGTGIGEYLQQIEATASASYSERERLFADIREGAKNYDGTGLLSIYEMTHWVRMQIRGYTTPDGHTGILPLQWDDQNVAAWQEMNPDAILQMQMERVLWVTTVAATGHLLANGPHWNQSGMFPAVPILPDRVNGKWTGLIEPVMDLLKADVYATTDLIHSVRTTSNNAWKAQHGAIPDKDEFRRQVTQANGLIELAAGHTLDEVQRVENTTHNQSFERWAEKCSEDLAAQLVEANFLGGVQSSQESDKVVQTRIKQTIAKLAMPVYGLHLFWLRIHKLTVKSLPYAIRFEKMIRLGDSANGMLVVNQPVAWDDYTGEVIRTMNNLQGADFDYIESEADNSLTGREHERNLMREFFEAHANSSPEVMEAAALEWPSVSVQSFGQKLKAAREAKEQQPTPPEVKYSVSLSGKDLGLKGAQDVAVNIGVLTPEQIQEEQALPGGGIPPEQTPTPQGDIDALQLPPQAA